MNEDMIAVGALASAAALRWARAERALTQQLDAVAAIEQRQLSADELAGARALEFERRIDAADAYTCYLRCEYKEFQALQRRVAGAGKSSE